MSERPSPPHATRDTPPWKRKNPKSKSARTPLSDAQKAAARQRADDAGRRYPNLVDNMWAAKHVAAGTPSKTAAGSDD
ncbi:MULTISPECIES: hypothetical protein [Luteimonas]|uniref:hypothetical protein n=1 Tax=Luteimonas TaxID=83614 RepID=UPI000C7A1C59|nr:MULTISPECIES: hypothetical protein [Luteimonas]